MALNLEEGRGIAFAKTSKAGNEYFDGEIMIDGKRHTLRFGVTVHKDGPSVGEPKLTKRGTRQAWVVCEESVAAEQRRLRERLEYLENISESERTQVTKEDREQAEFDNRLK